MIYLLFKIINPATTIGVSNLKNEILKATLASFVNNVKYLLEDMTFNYTIITDKVGRRDDYVCHTFRDILSGPDQTFYHFIEIIKYFWDTGSEIIASDLIDNATQKYNNVVAAKDWTNTDPKDDKILALTNLLYKLEKNKTYVL